MQENKGYRWIISMDLTFLFPAIPHLNTNQEVYAPSQYQQPQPQQQQIYSQQYPAEHLIPPEQQQQQYTPPPIPQLSFRSPNGQYSPIWAPAGVAFAVPAPAPANAGYAYYAPNTPSNNFQQGNGYDNTYNQQQPRKPPVLLVGNFPPSATVRPTINPFLFHQTQSPAITRYSPPFGVPQQFYNTPPPPAYQPYGQQEQYGQQSPRPSPPINRQPGYEQGIPPEIPGRQQPGEYEVPEISQPRLPGRIPGQVPGRFPGRPEVSQERLNKCLEEFQKFLDSQLRLLQLLHMEQHHRRLELLRHQCRLQD
ncbi:unnamed protein product [Meloidogyne enterolobii]|uniref:Uncharacterized protein n=1 Tax=Meloidogyne enterolobii TaxID=390850 RepID=A0ACB0YLP2_MELEN